MMSLSERVADAARIHDLERLHQLASDPSPQVRREVAANTHTRADVLDGLAGDRDWRVRAAVGMHDNSTDNELCQLIDDPRWEVRLMMLNRSDLTLEVMHAVCNSDQDDARHVLAGQRRIPLEIAKRLASDPSWQVRRSLADNTVFDEIRAVLLNDPRPVVRRVAEASAHHDGHRPSDLMYPARDHRETPRAQFTSADLAHWPGTQRKPSTKWLKIDGNLRPSQDVIHLYVMWLWQVAADIDQDPAWIEWWSHTDVHTLDLYPTLGGGGDHSNFNAAPNLLQVDGTSSTLSTHLEQIFDEHGDDAAADALESLKDPIPQLFLDLITTMLNETGSHLSLPQPPPVPQHRAQPPGGAA